MDSLHICTHAAISTQSSQWFSSAMHGTIRVRRSRRLERSSSSRVAVSVCGVHKGDESQADGAPQRELQLILLLRLLPLLLSLLLRLLVAVMVVVVVAAAQIDQLHRRRRVTVCVSTVHGVARASPAARAACLQNATLVS